MHTGRRGSVPVVPDVLCRPRRPMPRAVDYKKLRRLIKCHKLAPCYPGLDVDVDAGAAEVLWAATLDDPLRCRSRMHPQLTPAVLTAVIPSADGRVSHLLLVLPQPQPGRVLQEADMHRVLLSGGWFAAHPRSWASAGDDDSREWFWHTTISIPSPRGYVVMLSAGDMPE